MVFTANAVFWERAAPIVALVGLRLQVARLGVCILDLGWRKSGVGIAPAVAENVCRLVERWRAAAKPGRTEGGPLNVGAEGRHKAGTYGKQLGRRMVGLRNPVEQALVANVDTRSMRHVVGGGALRGRSPRTREGRIGPTAQNCSGQWSVVRDGAATGSGFVAKWLRLRCYPRNRKSGPRSGMTFVLVGLDLCVGIG